MLLLTRPMPECAASAGRLGRRGYRPVLLSPVLRIVALPVQHRLGAFDALLATSAHAFLAKAMAELLVGYQHFPLYVAGSKTLAAAQHAQRLAGIMHDRAVFLGPDAQALAQALADRPKSRFLYLAGRDRKPHVETVLTEAGHEVAILETYAAVAADSLKPLVVAALRDGAIGAVLHYSRRSAEIFLDLAQRADLGAMVLHLDHCCLSPDVAAPLLAFGAPKVQVAQSPDEKSLFALLPRP